MRILYHSLLSVAVVIGLALNAVAQAERLTGRLPERLQRLKISDNHRFIVKADGTPFFYLGDTAWELFHRTTRAEAERYLQNRKALGYTVIQVVALAELDGLNTPNANGHRPLIQNDPMRPDVKDGTDNDYWDHVDFIVKRAAELDLYIGFLPTWGDKWNKKWGVGPEVFTADNAATYGEWLGKRYKDATNLIWILGGDRPVETDAHKAIIRAMAQGLRKGDNGGHLMTFHPTGGRGSSDPFHQDEWLDFNMRQNGHAVDFNPSYEKTRGDYNLTPIKPVIDGEPIYEDHPINFKAKEFGHSVAADVRRPLYWDLFTGACGHTYGNHAIWQMWLPGREKVNNPLMPWTNALNQPGAKQMQYARWLLESRPFLTRIPDDSVIVQAEPPSAVPGAGLKRFVATRDAAGSYAFVYVPTGRAFSIKLDWLAGTKLKAWWFNPRNGEATLIGSFEKTPMRDFISPDSGENLDWVLVLDDASKKFPKPGFQPSSKR
jgi:Protein of unknown function (DUF4038)/Putative collagen-binding domain of a collagenase